MTDEIAKLLATAVKKLHGKTVAPEVVIADGDRGDFSSNVAFDLAKQLKRSPKEIAEQISGAISLTGVKEIVVAKPGFINISMDETYWIEQLKNIDANFTTSTAGKKQKVQVEFISANPTGPLTLANARGGYFGDVLSNILERCGFDVTREYYINDAGVQVHKLVQAVRKAAGQPVEGAGEYSGEYINDIAKKLKLPEDDYRAGGLIVDTVVSDLIMPSVKKMNISFDVWTKESQVASDEAAQETLSQLKGKELIEEDEGALWLRTPGDTRPKRVLKKSDGSRSYLLNDITYHRDVFAKRKFAKAIKIWGADHAGQLHSLAFAIEQLLNKKSVLEYVVMQIVRLMKRGKEVKISKRAGNIITVDDLLAEVESDVARFFFLMRSADTHMDFDLELAKEQSQKNPFWYVMYAYTRAQSINREAKKLKLDSASSMSSIQPTERLLIRHLTKLPILVENIARSYEVHKLAFYGMELAKLFHDFYEQERIIKLPPEQAAEKLFLLQKIITAMEVYWSLLGITPKLRM